MTPMRHSRVALIVAALFLLGPFVLHYSWAQGDGTLTYEQQQARDAAWLASASSQGDSLAWTRPGFDDSGWVTAGSGYFKDGVGAAFEQIPGWPNPEAEWIWSGFASEVYFRRRFGLPRRLIQEEDYQERVYVWLTASDDFIFYVNGQEIARDSIGAGDWHIIEGPLDVTEYLNVGDNVFAVWTRNDLKDNPDNYGLLFHAEYRLIGEDGQPVPTAITPVRTGC